MYKSLLAIVLSSLLFCSFCFAGYHQVPPRQFLQLRVYHAKDTQQVNTIVNFIQSALLPAAHRHGVKKVGAFTAIGNDTAADKRVYVLLPLSSVNELVNLESELQSDKEFQQAGNDFLGAAYDHPPFTRYETIVIRNFEGMPEVAPSGVTGPRKDRVYELRSYEGPTDNLYHNKVKMFNKGDEISIFRRLGFNAVFYGEVMFGSRMPNLMYMTSFENRQAREEHWKSFNNDPAWKQLSSMPEYQHNVSKADIFFLAPTEFSEL